MRALIAMALLILLGVQLRAEESFPVTHGLNFNNASNVSFDDRGEGLGILALDRSTRTLQYRMTVTRLKSPINGAFFVNLLPNGDVVLFRQLPIDANAITTVGTLSDITAEEERAMDRGTARIVITTVKYPEEHLVGRIEIVPSAITLEFDNDQETQQPVTSNGSGMAFIVLDEAAKRAQYTINWRTLTGPAQAAHFHRGSMGEDGPIVFTIPFTPGDSTSIGIWNNISEQDIAALKSGRIYANVHTAAYPNGEIRGQLLALELFTAAISPANEVPPVTGSNASGTGLAYVVSAPGFGSFYFAQSYVGGGTDTVQMAHIHRGAIGENGTIFDTLHKGFFGEWGIESDDSISAADLALFREGKMYLNYHTAAHPNGEMRGQLIPAARTSIAAVRERPAAESDMLRAVVDGSSGTVRFDIGAEAPRGERRIVLYTTLGERVAELTITDSNAMLESGSLAAGVYIAQLVVDGVAVAVRRIAITR